MNNVLPPQITDKIYEIRTKGKIISKIVSYFPLSDDEKNNIQNLLGVKFPNHHFHSIFTDEISDEKWNKSKKQIKNRFKNDLFDIDDMRS